MKINTNILLLLVLTIFYGCQIVNIIAEAEPEFLSTSGPTGTLNDLDFKPTRAEVDVKIFSDAEIIFVYAKSQAQLISIDSEKVIPECTSQGTIRNCRAKIPTAFDLNKPVFADNDTVFYQWFVEYGEAGSVKESNVASFEIEKAISCPFNAIGAGLGAAECDNTRACLSVTVQLLGTPGFETAPRCAIPSQ